MIIKTIKCLIERRASKVDGIETKDRTSLELKINNVLSIANNLYKEALDDFLIKVNKIYVECYNLVYISK